jgi:hypothetical protein
MRSSVAALFVACLVAAGSVHGQTPSPLPSAVTPLTASVVVHSSKFTYHLGEEIPLELEFRGAADKDYYFTTERCGFLARSDIERFAVAPSGGTDDPLADFYGSVGGIAGSCPSGSHELNDTSFVIGLSLNDALRFTRPGTFTVTVSSTRLKRHSRQPAPALTSVPIELTILPMDDAWAESEVRLAGSFIGMGSAGNVRHGAALLRYLGTESAARALVQHYDAIAQVEAGEMAPALIASGHRALIVQQMEALVDAGESLHPTFLETLTWLRVLIELPAGTANYATRRERTAIVQAEYDARWRAAFAGRPVTAALLGAELARLERNPSVELRQQIAQDLEQYPGQAAEAFLALPPRLQEYFVKADAVWPYLNRPWIVRPLRQVYAQSHGPLSPAGFTSGPGSSALKRLYEVVPEEGRRLILEEIRTGERGIGYDALAVLPEGVLPELDDILQARYLAALSTPKADVGATLGELGTTAWLMWRYGSAGLLPFVSGLLARPLPSCEVEGGFIAYLLKYDPARAMQRLGPGFDRSGGNICVDPLGTVAGHYWDERVESAAIAALAGAEIRRVTVAAHLLGSHGSSAAKQPLLDRLAAWSAQWKGRVAELKPLGAEVADSPSLIENNVVNALFQNERFGLTDADVANIRALCLTDGCQTNISGLEAMRAGRGLK